MMYLSDLEQQEIHVSNRLEQREIELNQRHEEILARREALLAAEESYYDYQTNQGHSFIAGCTQAMKRNEGLQKDLEDFMSEVKQKHREPDVKFQRISNNYWSMVRNVYPVWTDEIRDFKRRRDARRSVEVSEEFDPANLPLEPLPPLNPERTGRGSSSSLMRSEPGLRDTRSKTVSINPIPHYRTT